MHSPHRTTPVPSTRAGRGRKRAFTLLAILIIGIIVAAGAAALVLGARESAHAAADDSRSGEAWGVAMAGLTWAQLNLSGDTGKAALRAAAGGTATTLVTPSTPTGIAIHPFDANDAFAGVGVAPPARGLDTLDWRHFENGHFALVGAHDPLSSSALVVRAVGRVGDTQVVLETNLVVSVFTGLPAAFTGCFTGQQQVSFGDEESPYDYYGNMRFDGNGGVPIGMNSDHNRINGLTRLQYLPSPSAPPPDIGRLDPIDQYPTNLHWRGTQSLRPLGVVSAAAGGEPLALAIAGVCAAVSNPVGGTPELNMNAADVAGLAGWSANPYLGNDPRLVYFMDTSNGPDVDKTMGLGLNAGGYVDGVQLRNGCPAGVGCGDARVQRGLPIIAYRGTPNIVDDASGGFLGEEDWVPAEAETGNSSYDKFARQAFYACPNMGGEDSTFNRATRSCGAGQGDLSRKNSSWTNYGVRHSGRAWGFVESILRHCSGSGDSIDPNNGSPWQSASNPNGIKCASAFAYLENVAACLIVPRSLTRNPGFPTTIRGRSALRPSGEPGPTPPREAAGGDGLQNDFAGCHPGCLIAASFDSTFPTAETPYRSTCINLDAERVSSYGPDIQKAMRTAATSGPNAWDPLLPAVADTAPMGNLVPTYALNWMTYAAGTPRATTEFPGLDLADGLDFGAPPTFFSSDTDAMVGTTTGVDKAMDRFGNVINQPGLVSERGNPSLITRLDMTDRGPLGTCQQNCLGYGFGEDRTYGAHRGTSQGTLGSTARPDACVARVPKEPNGTFATVHCNLDYDRDGIFDRKSYAIASSYREECADPHDGIAWAPAFNISSSNTALRGDGCANALPNDASSAPTVTLTAFCDQSALQTAVPRLGVGATPLSRTNLGVRGVLRDGRNWFGGAKCHMGSSVTSFQDAAGVAVASPVHPHTGALASIPNTDLDAFGHPDYWIEDECPNPVVVSLGPEVRLDVGHICGCGVLVLKDTALSFAADSHLLWRGLVTWQNENDPPGEDELSVLEDGAATFVIEGGVLLTGDRVFRMHVNDKGDLDGEDVTNNEGRFFKQSWRQNSAALGEVFANQTRALKAVRRVR